MAQRAQIKNVHDPFLKFIIPNRRGKTRSLLENVQKHREARQRITILFIVIFKLICRYIFMM